MADPKKNTVIENVEKKKEEESRRFEELRDDLFNEAAKLVSDNPSARIAIFVTSPPSQSDGSVHSFAHPSVDNVVGTFLRDQSPEEEEEEEDPPFWWEDEKQYDSMNAEELKATHERLTRLRNSLRLHLEAKERAQSSGNQEKDQDGTKP